MIIGHITPRKVKEIEQFIIGLKPGKKPYIKSIPDIRGLCVRVGVNGVK